VESPVGESERSRNQGVDGLVGEKDRVTGSLGELLDAGSDVDGVADQGWPEARTVVAFRLSGVIAKASSWWLVVADGDADMCEHDPGYDVAATVSTSLRTLTRIWRGDLSWSRTLKDGSVSIEGPTVARRAVPTWLGQAAVAAIPRPA
jgi:hypothetical protein